MSAARLPGIFRARPLRSLGWRRRLDLAIALGRGARLAIVVAGGAVERLCSTFLLRDDVQPWRCGSGNAPQDSDICHSGVGLGMVLAETFYWSRTSSGDDDDVRLPGLLGNAQADCPVMLSFVLPIVAVT